MNTHPMWCCNRCDFAQYHPMNFCPKCPGQLFEREIPHPYGHFKDEKDQKDHLKKQGINYIGDYPKVSDEEAALVVLQRYKERLEKRIQEANEAEQNGDLDTANKIRIRIIPFWENEVREAWEKLNKIRGI